MHHQGLSVHRVSNSVCQDEAACAQRVTIFGSILMGDLLFVVVPMHDEPLERGEIIGVDNSVLHPGQHEDQAFLMDSVDALDVIGTLGLIPLEHHDSQRDY